jgi:thiosulfate reductase cytochrome b subunit
MAAIPLGIFLYAPWRENPTFLLIMSSVFFPLLTITGLWMWQGTRLQQWLGKYSTQLPQKRD